MKKALITLVLVSGLLSISTSAKANYLNGNSYAAEATKTAFAKKTVRVYKITTGHYESENQATLYGYLYKGTKVKRSNYIMSTGGWIIKSHKYYHNKRTFFLVSKKGWYNSNSNNKNSTNTTQKPKLNNYDLDYPVARKSLKDCIDHYVYTNSDANIDYPSGLATNDENYAKNKYAVKIILPGIPMKLIKLYSDENLKMAKVEYNGQEYVTGADPRFGDIVPYNTSISKRTVTSSVKPTNKSAVLLNSNNFWVNTKDTWEYTNPKSGLTSFYYFSLKKNKWYEN